MCAGRLTLRVDVVLFTGVLTLEDPAVAVRSRELAISRVEEGGDLNADPPASIADALLVIGVAGDSLSSMLRIVDRAVLASWFFGT